MKRQACWLSLLCIIIMILSLFCGRYGASALEAASAFVHGGDPMITKIILQIRLPRILFVAVSGAVLALSGAIFQTVFKNPLASGDIIGASSGCALGAAAAILCFASSLLIWASSFVCGLAAILLCVLLALRMKGSRTLNYVVSGLIIQALCTSALMIIKLLADPYQQLGSIEYWLMGGFSNIGWNSLFLLLPIDLFLIILLYRMRWQIQLLVYGKEADSLGIHSRRIMIIVLILASLLISSVIAAAGIVSWVGLLVPHLIRLAFHRDFTSGFLLNLFGGAAFLLICDTMARCLFPIEIPISIITSLFGALFLIMLLIKGKINI